MPAELGGRRSISPLPASFMAALEGHDELLVSSRDGAEEGSVRMWFAPLKEGFVLLLTPAFTVKAQRWQRDPWIRLRVPGAGPTVEGAVVQLPWRLAEPHAALLVERFALAGAATTEALRWMLEDGSRLLLQVGVASKPNSEPV